ncbi:hypothetical protein [Endozoicomonas acroporae]|uniref:hypothetical protein n=1 Tax=Endozoicomonas acroporae TaxID=1701104 RepID=UPI003D7A3F37
MNTPPKLIEAEIAAALAPLVSDRAFPVVMPQNVEYPAITFHRLKSEQRTEDAGVDEIRARPAQGIMSTFQIVIWAKSYLEGIQVFRQAKDALEGLGLFLDNAADGYDDKAELYTVVQEYGYFGDLNPERVGAAVSPPIIAPVVNGILDTVRSHFEQRLAMVEWYSPFRLQYATPAVFLELSNMSLGTPKGDETIPVSCNFQLLAAVPRSVGDISARDLAAELSALVYFNKWNQGASVSIPDDISADPVVYTPTGSGLLVWSVSWSQTVHVDISEPEPPCHLPPDTVLAGYNDEQPGNYETLVEDNRPV